MKGGCLECFHLCLSSWCCVCTWFTWSQTFFLLIQCCVENSVNWASGASLGFKRILPDWHYSVLLKPRLQKIAWMGKNASFPLTSPLRTQAHVHTRSYQKLDRNPVNMKMLKSLNLEWPQKTKGCQIALKNSIPLLCIFRGFYIPLRESVCVYASVVEVTETGTFYFVCF